MFNYKFLLICFIATLAKDVAYGDQHHPLDEVNERSFENFMLKTNRVNSLRKSLLEEFHYFEKTLTEAGDESLNTLIAFRKIKSQYYQLNEELTGFIPNEELLSELSHTFKSIVSPKYTSNYVPFIGKRALHNSPQDILKRFYYSKVPVIRNGRK